MKKMLSHLLYSAGILISVASLAIALLYIFADIPNPIIWLHHGSNSTTVSKIILWPLGLLAYLSAGYMLSAICLILSKVSLIGWSKYISAGSIKKNERYQKIEYRRLEL